MFTAGCEQGYPTTSQVPSLVVHGMLAADEPRQEILVEYTRSLSEGYFKGLTPASGARVAVVGNEAHPFQEDPARPRVYVAAFAPRPGERVSLQVQGPAGEVVTAETMIPEAPRLVSPEADTTVAWGGYVTPRWSSVPTAGGYVLTDSPPGQPSPIGSLLHPTVLGDTAVQIQPGKFGGTTFHIRVAAVDRNYERYMQRTSDSDDRSRIRSTVTGGYGLFGSYAVSNSRLVSVK